MIAPFSYRNSTIWPTCAERPPLATDAPVFPRLAKQALCEIEAFLGFRQFLLDVLDGVFKGLEPCRDLG